jgi:hypothetical protein
MTQQISPRDYELLSAYLDGELSTRDRARLEARMTKQPELRIGLEELRQTSLLLRSLPRKRAPRNFTIPNALPRRRPVPRLFPALRFASALAGILFVIVFIGDYALGISTNSLTSKIPASTSAPTAVLENQADSNLATTAAAPAAPAPVNPPAAQDSSPIPTETPALETYSLMFAPTETPTFEPGVPQASEETPLGFSSQATGLGGGAAVEGTPQPTETLPPTSEADTSDAISGGSPTLDSSAASSAPAADTPTPTPSVEAPAAPDLTPEISTRNQQGSAELTENAPTATEVPGARVLPPSDTPTAEAASQESRPKVASGITPTEIVPQSPTEAPAPSVGSASPNTPTTAPAEQQTMQEKLSQPYAQMVVRLVEIGLAGFAILAGLAAIFLRINSRS